MNKYILYKVYKYVICTELYIIVMKGNHKGRVH